MEGSPLGVRKGAWTEQEDVLLKNFIQKHGEGKWHQVPSRAGLNRCRKSCRLRWLNYLRPNIKRGEFSYGEVDLIIRLHKLLGNRWSLIAGRLPGRTANDVKNYWNTHLRKKMVSQHNDQLKYKNQENPVEFKIIKPQPRTFSKSSVFWSRANGAHEKGVQLHDNPNKLSPPPPLVPRPQDTNNEIDPWWESLFVQNKGGDNKTATSSISWPEDDPLIIAKEWADQQEVAASDHGTKVGGPGHDCNVEGHSWCCNCETSFGMDIWDLLDLEKEYVV